MNNHARKQHGFTLVELLVVMAIISILAGILLPTLATALDAARNVQCANQLKQFGVCVFLYADEWDGNTPNADMCERRRRNQLAGSPLDEWWDIIYPLIWPAKLSELQYLDLNMDTAGNFMCPLDVRTVTMDHRRIWNWIHYGYSLSSTQTYDGERGVYDSIVYNIYKVPNPGELFMMSECQNGGLSEIYSGAREFGGPGLNKADNVYHTYKKNYPSMVTTHPTSYGAQGNHYNRSRLNYLFFDAHLGSYSWQGAVDNKFQTVVK